MKTTTAIYQFTQDFVDIFFPPRCAACSGPFIPQHGLTEQMFCPTCCISISPVERAHCPSCALPYETATTPHLCAFCQTTPPPFTRTYAPFAYGGALADAIWRYKYHQDAILKKKLSILLQSALPPTLAVDIVVPVPLDNPKLRHRGFNQSALLAREVGRRCGLPVDYDTLFRTHQKGSQVGKTREERLANLATAFWCKPKRLQNRRVLLIDDVITTTATVRAASQKMLRQAGAAEVQVACVARTP